MGFLSLIGACLVFARRFAGFGQRGWAAYCTATGVIFFAAFGAIASLPGRAGVNVLFTIAVVLVWGWLSVMAGRLMTGLSGVTDSRDDWEEIS